MDLIQRGIISLLSSAVTGEKHDLPLGFSLEQALPYIKKHHMIPLCYAGAVNCGIPSSDPLMQQLFQSYLKAMLISERQMKDVQRIFDAFDQHQIDYMPLKGCRMKLLYPKPELRTMGDADILIRTEQYETIRGILTALGFEEKQETDHELIWLSSGLFLELHKRLIPSYNKDYFAYFGDGWQLGIVEQGCRYAMQSEDEWVYLFTHFAKHYRDGGIGCRHVVDLWVWLRHHPELDWTAAERKLTKLQLWDFCRNMRRLLNCWFENGSGDEITDLMTQYIFDSGSWGQETKRLLSASLKKSKSAGSIRSGRIRAWITAFFPSAAEIAPRYPVLKRFPWMLPLVWPYRWIRAAIFGRDVIRKRKKEMDITTEDQVSQHQQALQVVGLDFHFE